MVDGGRDSPTTVQLLVVGLGPAGATAAQAAAQAGLSVIAVDRRAHLGVPVQCAEFIPRVMGGYVRDASRGRVQTVNCMRTELPSGFVSSSASPGFIIDRQRFDVSLAEQAQGAGARIWPGSRLTALDPMRSTASVQRPSGAVTEVRYTTLIGADGPRSSVAAALGVTPLSCVSTRQYSVPLRCALDDTVVFLSWEYPGGYAWLFPKGATANLGVGVERRFARDLKQPLDRLHRRLIAQGVVGRTILGRTGGALPVCGLRSPLLVGSVLFAGDAAGLTHPVTGAGIHAAVVSGDAAGRAAAARERSGAGAWLEYEEEICDCFASSLRRAVARRHGLEASWRGLAARSDSALRRGWVAYDEYFHD